MSRDCYTLAGLTPFVVEYQMLYESLYLYDICENQVRTEFPITISNV